MSRLDNALVLIKRVLLARRGIFTRKAKLELEEDDLTESEVVEAVINARNIDKVLTSRNPWDGSRERLYVISAASYVGLPEHLPDVSQPTDPHGHG